MQKKRVGKRTNCYPKYWRDRQADSGYHDLLGQRFTGKTAIGTSARVGKPERQLMNFVDSLWEQLRVNKFRGTHSWGETPTIF